MKIPKNNYYLNKDTQTDIFYHSSKKGIDGKIMPNYSSDDGKTFARKNTDFGQGFYIGTKYDQALSHVNNDPFPFMYEIKIPLCCITEQNTLKLSKEDWVYFVLYNRKRLEPIRDTEFYKYYEHLADNKQFIIGPIADDVFNRCINDFVDNNITDYTFRQLIDCFHFGNQIVAKTQKACDMLQIVSETPVLKKERKISLNKCPITREEKLEYYEEKKLEFNIKKEGRFLSQIFDLIKNNQYPIPTMNNKKDIIYKENIEFPNEIHEEENNGIELY